MKRLYFTLAQILLLNVLLAQNAPAQIIGGGGSGGAGGTGCLTGLSTAIQKGDGAGGCTGAAAGTDYAAPTSGSAILKGNGAGGFSAASAGTDYAAPTSGSLPLFGNGAGGFSNGSVQGNTTKVQTFDGIGPTSAHLTMFDANGNTADALTPVQIQNTTLPVGNATTTCVASDAGFAGERRYQGPLNGDNTYKLPGILASCPPNSIISFAIYQNAVTPHTVTFAADTGTALVGSCPAISTAANALMQVSYIYHSSPSPPEWVAQCGPLTYSGTSTEAASFTGTATASRCVHTDANGNLTVAAGDCGTGVTPAGGANTPLFDNGAGGFTNGTRSGNTTEVATFSGAATGSRCVHTDANGNMTVAGADCGTGGAPGGASGNPQYNSAGTLEGIARVIHMHPYLTSDPADPVHAAQADCPTNGPCTLIADPDDVYPVPSPFWLGNQGISGSNGTLSWPQTLIIDHSQISCTDTTPDNVDNCIIMGNGGTIETHGYNPGSSNGSIDIGIKTANTAVLDAVLTTVGGVKEPAWTAGNNYKLGQIIHDAASHVTAVVSACSGACTSGAGPAPSFSTTIGNTTVDNLVTWTTWAYNVTDTSAHLGGTLRSYAHTLRVKGSTAASINYVARISGVSGGEIRWDGLDLSAFPAGSSGLEIDPGQDNAFCTGAGTPINCCSGAGAGTCQSGASQTNLVDIDGIQVNPGVSSGGGPLYAVHITSTASGATMGVHIHHGQIADVAGVNNIAQAGIDGSNTRSVSIDHVYFEIGNSGAQTTGYIVLSNGAHDVSLTDNIYAKNTNQTVPLASCIHIQGGSTSHVHVTGRLQNNATCTDFLDNALNTDVIPGTSVIDLRKYDYNGPNTYSFGDTGYVHTPTVTAGGGNATATLLGQCSTASCTDTERLANAANAGTLTITSPASTAMADGQELFTVVNTTGTAPTDVVWVAGAGVTLKSGVIGLTAANLIGTTSPDVTARNTACGTPPSTGSAIFKWNWNATSGNLRLLGCTIDPPGSVIPVALGGLIGSTIGPGFNFVGAVSASEMLTYVCGYTLTFPAGIATSQVGCGTNGGETDDYIIAVNGTQKGDVSLASGTCTPTWTAAAQFTCTAGQKLTVTAPGTITNAANIGITLVGTR